MNNNKPGVMKNSYRCKFRILFFLSSAILLGACGPAQFVSSPLTIQAMDQDSSLTESNSGQPTNKASGNNSIDASLSQRDTFVGFEGSVFVASVNLIKVRWQEAGWDISQQSIDTDSESLPADCTLYPHRGVNNQWVGNCTGYVLVPKDGASHISVMHTGYDGNTKMIQIAPAPNP
jgi:hypothetical protein